MSRPKYPKPDQNRPVRCFLRANQAETDRKGKRGTSYRYRIFYWDQYFIFLDISSLPNQIDWLILSENDWYFVIEEKQPGEENSLTDGENEWTRIARVYIVTQAIEIPDILSKEIKLHE